jgi:glucose-1-phosphate thymidylyltransferase
VEDPERYGVVEMSGDMVLSLEEKPKKPKSNYAIPGLYLFDYDVVEIAEKLRPSKRGELEITDVIREYLRRDSLNVFKLPRGTVWLDAGTPSSLFDSSAYVQAIEKRQGVKIGCPEEAAYIQGYINKRQLKKLTRDFPDCEYKNYLLRLLKYEK